MEQTKKVTLLPLSQQPGAGTVSQQVDFYLQTDLRATAGPLYAPGTIFVQEVPPAAKKLYEKGVGELSDKKEHEGFTSLRLALEVFPTYFDALDRLGTEYAVLGNKDKSYFEAAVVLLSKAVEINPKSFSSSFGLGFSQYHLGMVDQSIPHLERAVANYAKSHDGHLWLGIALKRAGKLKEAEDALKHARELGKGKDRNVHWHLAQLYSSQKRYTEAVAELELLLKKKPDAEQEEKIKRLIAQLRDKASK
jgi:tetratricopeptide (TPR) repeat protein